MESQYAAPAGATPAGHPGGPSIGRDESYLAGIASGGGGGTGGAARPPQALPVIILIYIITLQMLCSCFLGC